MVMLIGLGVSLAVAVFASLIWSGYHAFYANGWLRWAHTLTASCTIIGMAAITAKMLPVMIGAGVLMLIGAIIGIIKEESWSKAFPAFQSFFGLILVTGLPLM